jgi:hypothetical protein
MRRVGIAAVMASVGLSACAALAPEPSEHPCWGTRRVEPGTLTGVLRASPNDPFLASVWLVRDDGKGFEIYWPTDFSVETGPPPLRHHRVMLPFDGVEVAFAEEGDTVTVSGAWYPAGDSFFACELVGPHGPWPRPRESAV